MCDAHRQGLPSFLPTLTGKLERGELHFSKENLFTEYLAGLLKLRPAFLRRFLEISIQPDPNEKGVHGVEWPYVETQKRGRADERGMQPDLIVATKDPDRTEDAGGPHVLVAFEVKVKTDFRPGQLEDYHNLLETKTDDFDELHLVALTPGWIGRRAAEAMKGHPYWRGRILWAEVEELLAEEVQKVEQDLLELTVDDGLAEPQRLWRHSAFHTHGREFRELLVSEHLVAPTAVKPQQDLAAFRDGNLSQDRLRELARLLWQGVLEGGIVNILKEEVGWWRKQASPAVYENIEERSGTRGATSLGRLLRTRFQVPHEPRSFLFFGIQFAATENVRPPGDNDYYIDAPELIAGLEVGRRGNSRAVAEWLQERPNSTGQDRLDELVSLLNEGLPQGTPAFFRPQRSTWVKVARKWKLNEGSGWPADRHGQARVMGLFFQQSLAAFQVPKTDHFGRNDDNLLDMVATLHQEIRNER